MRRLILRFIVLTGVFAAPALAQTPPPTSTTAAPQSAEYVRTFFLTHAPVSEVQQALVQLTARTSGARPVITVSPTNNALTIRGTEAQLREVEEVIKQLDVAAPTQTPTAEAPRAQGGSGQGGSGQAPVAQPQNRLPNLAMLPSTTNIQLELTITDTISGSPVTKTVSMVILNGSSGMIRTATPGGDYSLNVDAVATAYQNGMIGVRITFDFTPPATAVEGKPSIRASRLNESLTVVVTDGKPMVVSQSADAASDRKVTASIKASVLK